MNTKLELKNVGKTYKSRVNGSVLALDDVNITISNGEFVCIVGPSGCGKTSLINLVLGLETPSNGEIILDGEVIDGVGTNRACVFQENTLFPWLSVRGNVELGLKVKSRIQNKISKAQRREIADKYLKFVGLEDKGNYRIHELSGGMKQRVSLARALALETEILLMDEPFAALDIATKRSMQNEILSMWAKTKKTIIFVTHDIEEAVLLAQRVVVLGEAPRSIKGIVNIDEQYPRIADSEYVLEHIALLKSMIGTAANISEVLHE